MKKFLLLIMVVLAVSIYSCQKDNITASKKAVSGTLSKNGRDTVPPAALIRFKVKLTPTVRDTVPPLK